MRRREMRRAERLVLQAGGYFFILIGIAYLYLSRSPALTFFETILPGIVFILVGVLLVWRGASSSPPLLEALKRRFPETAAGMAGASARAKGGIARLFRRR
jgi:hypothetical protein